MPIIFLVLRSNTTWWIRRPTTDIHLTRFNSWNLCVLLVYFTCSGVKENNYLWEPRLNSCSTVCRLWNDDVDNVDVIFSFPKWKVIWNTDIIKLTVLAALWEKSESDCYPFLREDKLGGCRKCCWNVHTWLLVELKQKTISIPGSVSSLQTIPAHTGKGGTPWVYSANLTFITSYRYELGAFKTNI